MTESHLFDVLLSGFVGSAIGALATGFVYWHAGRTNAKTAILAELAMLRHRIWWEGNAQGIFSSWNNSLPVLWPLYFQYYSWCFFWQKRRLNTAWRAYKGVTDEMAEYVPDTKRHPRDKEEFMKRINDFMSAIGADKKVHVMTREPERGSGCGY